MKFKETLWSITEVFLMLGLAVVGTAVYLVYLFIQWLKK